jgi:heme-degrading monooxygenase HmoA
MSEFQDFLTRKFAHVTVGEFKLGKFEEAAQIYEEAVSTYGAGFEGAYLLREQGTDRGISIIFWDSQEDMEANISEAHKLILKKMMPLFATTPTDNYYEVMGEIQPETNDAV